MPKHKINWVNDHTQICDRLDERVQLMQDYLNSRSPDFDGIAAKRFLLGQAPRAGVLVPAIYRGTRFCGLLGCVVCRRALETGQTFLEHYLPTYNFRETERGTEYKRDPEFPILPPMWSRRDPDDERDFPDVSETPDSGLPDLR